MENKVLFGAWLLGIISLLMSMLIPEYKESLAFVGHILFSGVAGWAAGNALREITGR